jgi:hypothetical protein
VWNSPIPQMANTQKPALCDTRSSIGIDIVR